MKTFFVLLFTALMTIGCTAGEGDKASLNEAAPNFELTSSDGTSYSLSGFKGKWVVLEWVNFGCPFVRKHYDSGNMQKLQKTYSDKEVIWLSICSSADGKQGYYDGEDLSEKLDDEKFSGTAYLIDAEGKVGKNVRGKNHAAYVCYRSKG